MIADTQTDTKRLRASAAAMTDRAGWTPYRAAHSEGWVR